MAPTVNDNDYLVADKLRYRFHDPARYDIVILRDPADASRNLIKRVIGLPGERMQVADCHVAIGGGRLAELYVVRWTRCESRWPATGDGAILGPGEFFVMGDNRDRSTDSRSFGPVRRAQIESRVVVRV
jgi:signal peptidase I